MRTNGMKRIVSQWLIDNYQFFTELLELAIFVHRRRSHLNLEYFDGAMSLDGQLKFNILSPIYLGHTDEILVFAFDLYRHNTITISYLDLNDADDMFGGQKIFDLLNDEDFIHFERCDMSDVQRAHKIIRRRLEEFAEP